MKKITLNGNFRIQDKRENLYLVENKLFIIKNPKSTRNSEVLIQEYLKKEIFLYEYNTKKYYYSFLKNNNIKNISTFSKEELFNKIVELF